MRTTEGARVTPGTPMPTATSLLVALVAVALGACSPEPDAPETQDAPQEPASTAAPEQKPASDDAYRFTIGAFEATALRDGSLEVPNDGNVFGINREPKEIAALLEANGLPSDRLALSCQPLFVRTADRVLLFDTGAGSNFGPGAGKLPASMAAAGIDAADVTDIFISHTHGDHIGGLVSSAGDLVFPNATVHISAPEWEFFEGMPEEAAAAAAIQQHAALVAAVSPKIDAFAPGAEIVPGVVEAVEIRGHTPGHSGYRISSGGDSLLYIGDTVHHSVVSVQRPDWTIAFDGDAPTAEASRKALLARSAESGQRIYAVHFPFPGLGRIESRDGELEWVPEQPQ